MWKRGTAFAVVAVVAVALLLVCIHAFHKPEANAKAAEAKAAAAAQDKAAAEDKAALESQQRVIQAVGGTACGVVASGISYGVLYGLGWIVTQGD